MHSLVRRCHGGRLVPKQVAVAAIETENLECQLRRSAGGTTATAGATSTLRSAAAPFVLGLGTSLRFETLRLLPSLTANGFAAGWDCRDNEDTFLPNHR